MPSQIQHIIHVPVRVSSHRTMISQASKLLDDQIRALPWRIGYYWKTRMDGMRIVGDRAIFCYEAVMTKEREA